MSKKYYVAIGIILSLLVAGILVACLVHTPDAPDAEDTQPSTSAPTEAPTEKPTEAPTEKPTEAPTAPPTEPPTEAPTQAPTQPPVTLWDGVVSATTLNIRSTPGGQQVGGYNQGTTVAILEEKTVNGTVWGRTNRGWISLDYVVALAPKPPEKTLCNAEPYTYHDINSDRFTVNGDKKTYNYGEVTISMPASWLAQEIHGEDGTDYRFKDPVSHYSLSYSTSEAYFRKWTEEDYLERFGAADEDGKILSLTEEKLSGFSCTKVVYTYTHNGTSYIYTLYHNVIVGLIMYEFSFTYPVAESGQFAPVFEDIVASIVLQPTY